MSKENNGGPAYPTQGYEGLTVRDYFAAKAMQGWLAGIQRALSTLREVKMISLLLSFLT